MSTENKNTVRRFFEEGLIAFDELLDPAFILHDAPSGLPPGIEGCKVIDVTFRTAFPDYKHTIHDLIAEGDKVVARWTFHGTNEGDFQGLPPTGKKVTIPGISVFRLVDGKIMDDWTISDTFGLMQQLGAIPTPGQSSS